MCVYGKVDTVVWENFTIKSFSVMVWKNQIKHTKCVCVYIYIYIYIFVFYHWIDRGAI